MFLIKLNNKKYFLHKNLFEQKITVYTFTVLMFYVFSNVLIKSYPSNAYYLPVCVGLKRFDAKFNIIANFVLFKQAIYSSVETLNILYTDFNKKTKFWLKVKSNRKEILTGSSQRPFAFSSLQLSAMSSSEMIAFEKAICIFSRNYTCFFTMLFVICFNFFTQRLKF